MENEEREFYAIKTLLYEAFMGHIAMCVCVCVCSRQARAQCWSGGNVGTKIPLSPHPGSMYTLIWHMAPHSSTHTHTHTHTSACIMYQHSSCME